MTGLTTSQLDNIQARMLEANRKHEEELRHLQEWYDRVAGIEAVQREKAQEYAFIYDLEEEDVIYFRLAFAPLFNKYYTYAAIKINGLWFSTGPKAPKGYSNDEMVRWWMNNDVQNVCIAFEWEIV